MKTLIVISFLLTACQPINAGQENAPQEMAYRGFYQEVCIRGILYAHGTGFLQPLIRQDGRPLECQ